MTSRALSKTSINTGGHAGLATTDPARNNSNNNNNNSSSSGTLTSDLRNGCKRSTPRHHAIHDTTPYAILPRP
ncbi:hypothetical protein AND_009765 [Anopheles darlingi]|uniref:Uncharacterized protein n=1 Tax=Anopheles darlingi TaxID=43151 RepID=W5J7B7_ANODA|nr:hypothetical protein AND_009765 [Anopheles darlingi]